MPEAITFSQAIREQTRELHDAAERHPFQAQLVQGKLPKAHLIRFLEQLFHVHRALGLALRTLREQRPELAPLILDRHFQEQRLLADIRSLGGDPGGVEASTATQAMVKQIEEASQSEPLQLLGHHYVLEGSNNGAQFFVKTLRKSLGLAEGEGLGFFDPHGAEQRAVWGEFKGHIDELASRLPDAERNAILQGIHEMYKGHLAISQDLDQELASEQ